MTEKKAKGGKGLLVYLIVILSIAILLLCALWILLGRYEATTSEPVVTVTEEGVAVPKGNPKKEAVDAFLKDTTPEYWTDQWFKANPDSLDSYDGVKAYMEQVFSSADTSCWRSIKSTADDPVYVIKNGETPLAEIKLGKNGKDEWEVSETVLQITCEKEGTVTAPADCTVRCNGTVLGEEYIVQKDVDLFFIEDYAETRENPVLWNTWKVTGLLLGPELTVASPTGKDIGTLSAGEYVYLCEAAVSEKHLPPVKEFTERLILFFMNGENLTAYNAKRALNYVREGSQAEEVIRSVVRGVYLGTYYKDYQLDYSCGPFVQWADNCIGCDVDYTITNIDEDQAGTLRILLIDYGKGYEICGLGLD